MGREVKQNVATVLGVLVVAWCSGCAHNLSFNRPTAEVVRVAQSLAPWSVPPSYRVEAKPGEQEWLVLIREPVPGRKFEHYEITFWIRQSAEGVSEVRVTAERVSTQPLNPWRENASRLAGRYAARLTAVVRKAEAPPSPAGAATTDVAPEK